MVTQSKSGSVVTVISTSVLSTIPDAQPTTTPGQAALTSSSASATPNASNSASSDNGSNSGMNGTAKVVIAVVVPIIGVALIAIALLFFWKKRRRDKENTEKSRKEVEEYGYNPNSSPTGMLGGGGTSSNGEDGTYDMVEDSVGYRGWGSTNGGRKVSNLSSSVGTSQPLSPVGLAFIEGNYQENGNGYGGVPTSPGAAPSMDGNMSNAPLITTPPGNRPGTADSNVVVAMTGTLPSGNTGGIHRGISNASSNYSTMTHSDQSDNGIPPGHYDVQHYGVDGGYDDGHNYSGPYQQYPEAAYGSPPVIREVQARRNTQIETPTNTHFPQQGNSGIAQNF